MLICGRMTSIDPHSLHRESITGRKSAADEGAVEDSPLSHFRFTTARMVPPSQPWSSSVAVDVAVAQGASSADELPLRCIQREASLVEVVERESKWSSRHGCRRGHLSPGCSGDGGCTWP